ncbi:putative metallo-beta-lactamase domain protein [Corynespora cassiicola Philippines]|uniref:Putative metallo-beta-lactamase domain protein n=1 Tax=Corynespora cassiicola Philippines TaxID=1448308 RepID=A0A2T2N059_CORCC|nr:putative metallo-beta-lactamase domain protein [Corynespora cassiicola Philippines]
MSAPRAAVYVTPSIPWMKPNGTEGGPWSPISSTLIYGEKEAILVDAPITKKQSSALADWVASILGSRIRLVALYVTHGHGDHWFGIPTLIARFPGLRVIATRGTIQHMREDGSGEAFKRWTTLFPAQIDDPISLDTIYELPSSGEFRLENYDLRAIEVGHSDTHDSTILWVPEIKLAVCGDVVYGHVHQLLATAKTPELRQAWIRAIELVEALKPEMVVPGHQLPGELPGRWHLTNSKQYINDFTEMIEMSGVKDARDLSRKMMEKYPDRFNKGALVFGCVAAFSAERKSAL